MDKVIIDRVDVSGCEFIGDIKNEFVKCTSWVHNSKKQVSGHWDCRENKACYYKELKRLQAENEELKNDILNGVMCITCPDKNENCRLQAENEHYRKEAYRLADGLNKTENLAFTYKQALQEIREYCEEQNLKADYTACEVIIRIDEVIGAE